MTSHASTPATPPPAATFHTTQWTRVLAARGDSPESQAALGDLCAAYYAPVQAFIRRSGRDADAARELTQEFFARLLARQGLDTVDQGRGRFRSFLLAVVKHFLADMTDHARAAKRGSGETPLPLAADTDTEPALEVSDPTAPNPEREFDRKWALTVLDRALVALAREQTEAGHATHFATLKPWLTGDSETVSQAEAARSLDMNEGAVKVAIHRLRRRFRDLVKAEIAQTLSDPTLVKEELACLQAALAGA